MKIKNQWKRDGFDCKVVGRCGNIILVELSKDGQTGWEVIKVRRHVKDLTLRGKTIAQAGDEYLPSSSRWGLYGWSFLGGDAAGAIRKFIELSAEEGE
jgi:hypothetical protein